MTATPRPDLAGPLQAAARIGLMGDVHGDLEHMMIVLRTFRARGVGTIVQLGDFGFIWPGVTGIPALEKLSRRLAKKGQTLYFVDGNHEDHRRLAAFPVHPDGIRWVRPTLAHLPREYRTTLASGWTLAALGGANSIDRAHRTEGTT